jgi:hypothetical protein
MLTDDELNTTKLAVHDKSGGIYNVIGVGRIQTDTPLTDMTNVVIYFNPDSGYWVRPVDEFKNRFSIPNSSNRDNK